MTMVDYASVCLPNGLRGMASLRFWEISKSFQDLSRNSVFFFNRSEAQKGVIIWGWGTTGLVSGANTTGCWLLSEGLHYLHIFSHLDPTIRMNFSIFEPKKIHHIADNICSIYYSKYYI